MANINSYPVVKNWLPDDLLCDGYVSLDNTNGHTVTSIIGVTSPIASIARTGTGAWTITLTDCWQNMNGFSITPVCPASTSLVVVEVSNNIATNTVPGSGVINFQVLLSTTGAAHDLETGGGFHYHIMLYNSASYQAQ